MCICGYLNVFVHVREQIYTLYSVLCVCVYLLFIAVLDDDIVRRKLRIEFTGGQEG